MCCRPDWAADGTLAEIMRRILAAGEPQKIVLFGSRARGDARDDSDYDLLLVEPSELPRHKHAARYRRALTGLAGAKDILIWTPEEVAQWRDVPNASVTAAVQDGLCSMSDRCDLARDWLLKARSDLNACLRVLETDGPHDTGCFHAQ